MSKKLILVTLLLFTLAVTLGSAKTLVERSIFLTEKDNQPVAISKEEFYQTDTGYLYTIDFIMMTEVLGQISTMRQYLEIELNHDGAIVSAWDNRNVNGFETYSTIEIDYSQAQPLVTVILNEQGLAHTETYQLEPGQKVYYPDTTLDMVVASDGLIPGNKYDFLFFEDSGFRLEPGSYVIGDPGDFEIAGKRFTGHHIEFHIQGMVVDLYTDQTGRMIYSTSPAMPSLVSRRVNEEELPELGAFSIDLTTKGANIYIARPYRAVRSRITVSNLLYNAVNLEDNRQKIIEQKQVNGKTEVLLEIKKDSRTHQGKYKLPITNAELDVFLKGDYYIDPTSLEIQRLAAQILQGETDAWRSVAKLTNWVFNYLDSGLTVAPKTTAQILAEPVGNCKEYAILFASLAKAAGIPTRVAEGFRYSSGFWFGHMWNEVWIGEWIAVDPSHGQLAPDALLVKLNDNSTVTGAMLQTASEILNVEIAIRLVDSYFRRPKAVLETGVSGQTFTNEDFAFSITIPEQWSFAQVATESFLTQPDNQLANIAVELAFLVPGYDLSKLMDQQLQGAALALPDSTFYGPEQVSTRVIDGHKALTANWVLVYEGLILYQEIVLLSIDDMYYSIVFTVPAMNYELFADSFEQALDSIRIHW